MTAPTRAVKVNEELLINARSISPLASLSKLANDALREWIERRQPKADGDEPRA